MIRPTSLLSALLLLPLLGPGLQAGNEVALERALDSVKVERLSADLHFLACDELGGRDSPSVEQRIAARFLVNRVKRLGLQPGAGEGYLWEYGLPMTVLDADETRMVAKRGETSLELELGPDYGFFSGMSQDSEAVGPVVFAGELRGDERDASGGKMELTGAWALCTSHEDVSFRDRVQTAREAGAVGVIVVSPLGGEDEMLARCAGYAEQLSRPRIQRGRRDSARRSFPYVYMTHAGLRGLMELAGVAELAPGVRFELELSERRAMDSEAETQLENVCALWPGSDPELAKEVIILSAHYDHVGRVAQTGDVFNGADDNGSGTTGLLAVAEALTAYGPLRRSVLLTWVSAEEKGLLGSRAWSQDPLLPEGSRAALNLNIDMIGRNAPHQVLVTPTSEHEAYNFLTRLVEKHAPAEGFTEIGSADEFWNRSDQANFSKYLEIPVAFLFTGLHEDYHRPTDTPDKIDYDKMRRVVRLLLRMLDDLQTDSLG